MADTYALGAYAKAYRFKSDIPHHMRYWCSMASIPVFQTGGDSSNLLYRSRGKLTLVFQTRLLIVAVNTFYKYCEDSRSIEAGPNMAG